MWSIARSSNPNDEAVELTGTREEKLAEVRATFGENFIIVYTALTLLDKSGVVFFATEAQVWPWIARMFGHGGVRAFAIYNSRGSKLGEANNSWDDLTRAEFDLRGNEAFLARARGESVIQPSPEEFLRSLPLAELNRLGLPQRDTTNTAARVAELTQRANEVNTAAHDELAKREQ